MATLENGKEFSLRELLSGDNKVIIPDLQRDYCWGDKAYVEHEQRQRELVTGFVGDYLLLSYKESAEKELMLGLVYGYEEPVSCYNICDGQQRITTLFLLLGMVNRYSNNAFADFIISPSERKDDNEPHLLYSIRESTLFFLSDLSLKFFINDAKPDAKSKVSSIRNSEWYFEEYEKDASVQSMLAALAIIEKLLEEENDIDYVSFGNFLLNKLRMIYYDMENRARGEETYIVINTTGEPLSSTENIKPILLGNIKDNKDYNEQWEKREDWFWQNRGKDLVADDGMKQFFIWFWQSRKLQEKTYKDKKEFPIDPKKEILGEDKNLYPQLLDDIDTYFSSLKYLIDVLDNDDRISQQLSFIKPKKDGVQTYSWLRDQDINVVLPLLEYIKKFPNPRLLLNFVRRIRRNWFDLKREQHTESEEGQKPYSTYFVDWRYVLQIIRESKSEEDVLCFDTENNSSFQSIPNVRLNQWYNEDEKNKANLLCDNPEREPIIWEWEDNQDIMGDLSILWKAMDNPLNWDEASMVFGNFALLHECFCNEKYARENQYGNLANFYRLFRVLRGFPAPDRIYKTKKNMNGAWFSWRDDEPEYFRYMNDSSLIGILKANSVEDILSRIKEEVRKSVIKSGIVKDSQPCIDDSNFNSISYLKLWLTSKVLWAESKNLVLSYYDGNGIAAWDDCKENKIDKDKPFSIANSHCGYVKLSPANQIVYVAEENKGREDFFDTLISLDGSVEDVDNKLKDLFRVFLTPKEDS